MRNDKYDISWAIVILAFIVFWPVGIFLLYKKVDANKRANMSGGIYITAIGWILLICGIFAIFSPNENQNGLDEFLQFVLLFCSGVGLILLGMKTKHEGDRFKKYITMIVNQGESDMHIIASTLNIKYVIVRKDIEKMIAKNYLSGGYIDERTDKIIIPRNQVPRTPEYTAEMRGGKYKVVKCNNCSATNKIIDGSVSECEYCGSPLK